MKVDSKKALFCTAAAKQLVNVVGNMQEQTVLEGGHGGQTRPFCIKAKRRQRPFCTRGVIDEFEYKVLMRSEREGGREGGRGGGGA